MISKEKQLFFSVSSNPGKFGVTLYNEAFKYVGIDATYEPLKLERAQFKKWLDFAIENENYKGVSVSMPFKQDAYNLCSKNESPVKNINTIKIDNGDTTGYNTDTLGFESACSSFIRASKCALIYGTGAVSDSIEHVLEKNGINVVKIKRGTEYFLGRNDYYKADTLINATCVGMSDVPDTVFSTDIVEQYNNVFDVVVSKDSTNLIDIAKKMGKPYIEGYKMSYEQLCSQFEIYTNEKAPRKFLKDILERSGYG